MHAEAQTSLRDWLRCKVDDEALSLSGRVLLISCEVIIVSTFFYCEASRKQVLNNGQETA